MSSELICIHPNSLNVPPNSNHFIQAPVDSLNKCSTAQWKALLSEVDSNWVTFATSAEAVEKLSLLCKKWNAPETDAKVIIDSSLAPQPVFYAWKYLPEELASCLYAPEAISGFILSRENLMKEIPNDDYPLWKFIQEHKSQTLVHKSKNMPSILKVENIQSLEPFSPIPLTNWVLDAITQLPSELQKYDIISRVDFKAIQSGVLLWMHDLNSSHNISQSIEGQGMHVNGDYWHGIMHRQEPDDSNAKYWFRHVGAHPVFPKLAEIAEIIFNEFNNPELEDWRGLVVKNGKWNPFAFIDLCSAARRASGSPLEELARQIQHWEMLLLMKQTVNDAIRMDTK